MIKRNINYSLTGFFLVIVLCISNCSGSQIIEKQTFQKINTIPSGKAVVYFYKHDKSSFLPKYFVSNIWLNENQDREVTLICGTYYPLIVNPGKLEFYYNICFREKNYISDSKNKKKANIPVNIKAGESYYVYWYVHQIKGWEVEYFFIPVSPKVGEEDIINCRLLRKNENNPK